MNDKNDPTRRRVEDLLRQWGAGEAASQAAGELSEPPSPKPRRRRAGVLLRWAPAGIAAALLLAAGALFMSTPMDRHGASGPVTLVRKSPPADSEHTVPRTQPDLSGELTEARNALAEAMVQKQADDLKIKKLLGRLTRQGDQFTHDREKWALLETKLTSMIAKSEQSAIDAKTELRKVEKALASARAAGIRTATDAEELKSLKVRLAAAAKELKRQRDTFRSANAERKKVNEAFASLKARHQAALDQIRRVYLAASAPDKTGLAALQAAMKLRGLLPRCIALQRKARTDADKKLLQRAEVALMRLGLLDLSDTSAVSAYITHLAKSDLIASLDVALGPLAADAVTQDWLFETKLILTGVQRVI
jgi:hypothetical protein